MSDMTLTEKTLARTSGNTTVKPGDVLWVEPDSILMYDWPGFTEVYADIIKNDLKMDKLPYPEKFVFFIDHLWPPSGEKEADFHHGTRNWAKEQGIKLYEGLGIGHQVSAELGLGVPGNLIIHGDMHVQVLGAFGASTVSFMGDFLTPWVLGRFWVEVPETINIKLEGKFQPFVGGRDLIHKIIYDLGPDGGIGSVLEFTGEGAQNMSIDERMNTLCQVMFCGALNGVFPADDLSLQYLSERTGKKHASVKSDPDVQYKTEYTYDLSSLEPYAIAPPNPGNAKPLKELLGTEINQGYIGSCASGRIEDIENAARILKGKKIKEGFRLFVVPTSKEILEKTMNSGALATLVEAGAFISSPTCDFCYGKTQSMSAGESAVSTGTLNVPGRLGSIEADIYLVSASCVAASACTGKITDPRDILS